MKSLSKILLFLLLVVVSCGVANAQRWDAASCADICYIVDDGGYCIDEVLQHKCGYTLINNINTDQGFGSLYARNVRVDINGNLLGLSKSGTSSVVIAHLYGGSADIVISFFSAANAKKFRDQAFKIGAQKVKVAGKTTYYVINNLIIEESIGKVGKFTSYNFVVRRGY